MARNQIEDYYLNQAGSGVGFYAGASHQKGYGIGGFLGGLFRNILPFLKSGAKAVGREALRAGSHVLSDVASGETPLKESLKRHAHEAQENLMQKLSTKMSGSGIKRKRLAIDHQSIRHKRRRNISARPSHRDIFSL